MRGKKDNIEWNKNILACNCPYCGCTASGEVITEGVFNQKRCPKCKRFYDIPKIGVYNFRGEIYIKLIEEDFIVNNATACERWKEWLTFWKENGYYHNVVKNVDGYELVQIYRYDGQDKKINISHKIFDKDTEVILSCEESVFLTLEKQDNKIIIRGEINA